jgi:hypothetical protein
MNSLKDCTWYVLEFDFPDSRGGVARIMGFYCGCFWTDDDDRGDRFPPAAEDSIYRAIREIDLWAA